MAKPTCEHIQRLFDRPERERRVGSYRLVAPLGSGGFAPVWKARELGGEPEIEMRDVAVKLFCVHAGCPHAADRAHVTQEAAALCSVEHPNVVRFYSFATDASGDVLGIGMEHANGESLATRIERGTLAGHEVIDLGITLASALAKVHEAGLVHRDVKPANVVQAGGTYRLIDFGIAVGARDAAPTAHAGATFVLDDLPLDVKGTKLRQLADDLAARGDQTFGGLPGAVMPSGTMGYIDPFCVRSCIEATEKSDLYSLGATLYECVSGSVPAAFAARIAGQRALKAEVLDGRESAPPLLTAAPDLSAGLARLVDALIDPEPAKRPASASALEKALVDLHPREMSDAPPPIQEHARGPAPTPTRRWIALGVVLAMVAGGATVWWRTHQAPPAAGAENGVTVDFDDVDAAETVDATELLKRNGMEVVEITPGTRLAIGRATASYERAAMRASTKPNVLFHEDLRTDERNQPAFFTLRFAQPLSSFGFTRPPLVATTTSGITFPAWSARAFDANGREVDARDAEIFGSYEDVNADVHVLGRKGTCIRTVRFDSDNRRTTPDGQKVPFAAFSMIVIDDLRLGRATPNDCR